MHMHQQSQSKQTCVFMYLQSKFKALNKNKLKATLLDYAKFGIYGTLITYFIGTAILLFRNYSASLPFAPLSIIHATVITIYFVLFFCVFTIIDHTIYFLDRIYLSIKLKTFKILFLLLILSIVCLVGFYCFFLAFINDSFIATIPSLIFAMIILVIIARTADELHNKAVPITSIMVFSLLSMIIIYAMPMSMGGLGQQKVAYYENINSSLCYEYDYYGTTDGMLILRNDTDIFLVPISNGYIKYPQNRYGFQATIFPQHSGCKVGNPTPAMTNS